MFNNASPCCSVCQPPENRNSYFSSLRKYFSFFTTSMTPIATKARQVSNILGTTSLWFRVSLDFHALCFQYRSKLHGVVLTYTTDISFWSCLQCLNWSADSTHRSVTNINISPIISLRALVIQFTKHQLQGITKSRVNGKRKQRPAGIRVTCFTATVFWRLNTVAGICVSKMFEIY